MKRRLHCCSQRVNEKVSGLRRRASGGRGAEAAQRLTVELATRAQAAAKGGPADLPRSRDGRLRARPASGGGCRYAVRPHAVGAVHSDWNKIALASEPAGW